MIATFTVPGEPRGKGRPRFVRAGRYVRTYTPDETASYENLIKLEYERHCSPTFFDREMPVSIIVTAYYGIPKSTSRKKRELMIIGEIRPMKKPDADNVLKLVEDALNTVAYHDDAQIVSATVRKYYSEIPRLEVEIFSEE